MSRLKELIAGLCPDGVEYKRLGDVLKLRNGKDYRHLDSGNIPVYGTGGIMTYVDTFIYYKPSVLIPRKGSLNKLYYVDVPFWNVDTIFYSEIFTDIVKPKFIYYVLEREHLEKLNEAGAVPSLTQKTLNKILIPIPPLEVQAEIVRILDKFTSLTAELTEKLTAELTLRRQQYEYYRDKLLTFGDEIPRVPLHDFATITRGVRVVRRDLKPEGQYPVYQNSLKPLGYHDKFNYPAGTAFVISAGSAGEIGYSSVDFWAADDCLCIMCSEHIDSRYLYHVLMWKQLDIKSQVRRSAVPRLPREAIENLQIPLPPIEQQIRIASILDRFDSLCNNLLHGLPAEISARRKQYEYYRDKLLAFTPKS